MYIIDNIIVSDDVTDEHFACNLTACKGACCWEGDFGAPLEEKELDILKDIYSAVEPYLTEEGKAAIAAQGLYTKNDTVGGWDTTLVDNAACAYMTLNEQGMALCGIEQAHRDGKIEWKKPISCHLYPIRAVSKPEANFEALNYDVWDICSAACVKGDREKIRVYEFAKPALIRKYGEDWYNALVAAVERETSD
ncbi:DUF3109 family protein [Neolewinella aurantiaca]|uniref:DUF3109 family protein n=1 Tax=Neolewinella aurantiaca TaxID=2602767 RepID=A0A5C7FKK8_9BACT|nr:DUF3109 family protein [Neolewinella aurantiaca]TXF87855.1 DUF3109 family protein [Neolewinella aurantiaca]